MMDLPTTIVGATGTFRMLVGRCSTILCRILCRRMPILAFAMVVGGCMGLFRAMLFFSIPFFVFTSLRVIFVFMHNLQLCDYAQKYIKVPPNIKTPNYPAIQEKHEKCTDEETDAEEEEDFQNPLP
jgi:hypothetical protein